MERFLNPESGDQMKTIPFRPIQRFRQPRRQACGINGGPVEFDLLLPPGRDRQGELEGRTEPDATDAEARPAESDRLAGDSDMDHAPVTGLSVRDGLGLGGLRRHGPVTSQPEPPKASRVFSLRALGRWVLLLFLTLLISGCGTEVLYSDLDESEANRILGLLMARGIPAVKQVLKENKYSVSVPRERFAEAVDLLEWYGIPAETYDGIGQVFQKSGMVSTPSEERIRYTYALGQDIAEMLSLVDGVVSARVQLVLPENDPYDNKTTPSSASVFLKFRPGDLPATLEPQVKQLVMNSVPGLTYERVAVTVMQSESLDYFFPLRPESQNTDILGVTLPDSSRDSLFRIIGIMALLIVVGFGAAGYFAYRQFFRKQKKKNGDGENGDDSDEASGPEVEQVVTLHDELPAPQNPTPGGARA